MQMLSRHIPAMARRFARSENGAQLVEFAIVLPLMLVIFAVIIEGGRLMWSYQATNSGVRDATRYLARVVPSDICSSSASVADWQSAVETIVRESSSGDAFFPTGITITAVTPSLSCHTGSYRVPVVAVAQVTANLTVTFPFAGVFELVSGNLSTISTSVSDQSRIFGT
ncbi:TadE/TadG family type IV pilus assembly protein [Aliiruegeria lutimaris]|uniref:Flp pilus assembly protein TadG n=1 Tax=Aliiruegeria lutimaris TaxID=571298 RepID=A0A1G9JXY8_9RHOB|nr:TadE/TadG family type IV pilus assembly protein [Aliiruegeria lutimaris]SDL42044.1 Flp pilus assembly protein TadG [Aliiruegeria lutimaris]